MNKIILATIAASLFWFNQAAAETVVIVNKANPMSEVSASKLGKYYKGLVQLWDNGTKAVPVDLDDSNPLAADFAQNVMGMDMEQKRSMWVRLIFQGKATPPRQFRDDNGVVGFVASTPGAVGYVAAGSVNDSVKVLTVK